MCHRSNAEIGQPGVGDIMSALFGGSSCNECHTAANVKMADGTSSGYGSCLHLCNFTLPHALRFIDSTLTCLASILMIVGYNMSGWLVGHMIKRAKSDVAVPVVTFI